LLIVNIESVPAMEALDEILAVPGLDAVLIGPHDLSCNLGLPERYEHPDFLNACETIFRKARAAGLGGGIHFWGGVEQQAHFLKLGANMIESPLVDVPEHIEWAAQGKMWLANVQAPGLIDTKDWTEENLLEPWLRPGTSTAHAERPGLEQAKVSGMQVDEYYPGEKSTWFMAPLARSLARLAGMPEAAGKFWIPFSQHLKDIRLILDAAAAAGQELPLTQTHRRPLEAAEAAGFGDADNSAMIRAFQRQEE